MADREGVYVIELAPDEPLTVAELIPCENPWHRYSYGEVRESIREYLICPECPSARHYQIARLARAALHRKELFP